MWQLWITGEHETVIFTANSVNGGSKPFQTCGLLLTDTPVTPVMDVRAKVSILSESVYRTHVKHIPCASRTTHCRHVAAQKFHWMEWTIIWWHTSKVRNCAQSFSFYVTQTGSGLLWKDLFDRLGFTVTRNGSVIQSVDIVADLPTVLSGFGKIARFLHQPPVNPDVKPVSRGFYVVFHSRCVTKCRRNSNVYKTMVWLNQSTSSPWFLHLVVVRRKSGEIRLVWTWKLWTEPSVRKNIHCQHWRNCLWTWDEAISKFPWLSTWQHSSHMRESSSTIGCRVNLIEHLVPSRRLSSWDTVVLALHSKVKAIEIYHNRPIQSKLLRFWARHISTWNVSHTTRKLLRQVLRIGARCEQTRKTTPSATWSRKSRLVQSSHISNRLLQQSWQRMSQESPLMRYYGKWQMPKRDPSRMHPRCFQQQNGTTPRENVKHRHVLRVWTLACVSLRYNIHTEDGSPGIHNVVNDFRFGLQAIANLPMVWSPISMWLWHSVNCWFQQPRNRYAQQTGQRTMWIDNRWLRHGNCVGWPCYRIRVESHFFLRCQGDARSSLRTERLAH